MSDSGHPHRDDGPATGRDVVRLNSASLRALAHPLRARLLDALRWEGPATATALAHRLGTNSGATSYHLRELERVGLVAEAEDLGTRRERWWRSVHRTTLFEPHRFQGSPDDRAAAQWLLRHQSRKRTEWLEDWIEARDHWPEEWRGVSDLSDYRIHLTPDRLRELNDEIHAVLRRYHQDADPEEPGAEQVLLLWTAFPHRSPDP
jgi:DNA-binding transcriptional ArsR family regulator